MAIEARNYYLLGGTDAQVADLLGISVSTLRKFAAIHPEFAQAKKEGSMMANANVAASMYRQALGYTTKKTIVDKEWGERVVDVEVPPNVTAGIFWLKCRAGWKDQPVAEGDKPPVPLNDLSDREVARRIAFLLAKSVKGTDIEEQ